MGSGDHEKDNNTYRSPSHSGADENLSQTYGAWPPGFFDLGLTAEELRLLRDAGRELEQEVLGNRLSKGSRGQE
jgi:hypothetical protein